MHGPLNEPQWGDIVEASFLEPTGEKCGTIPTPEEEAILMGRKLELPEAPEAAASLPECPEIPNPMSPLNRLTL